MQKCEKSRELNFKQGGQERYHLERIFEQKCEGSERVRHTGI